jgi:solute carrier family 45, member 1/2/4
MILSLHNIAIAGPQLIASLGSSLLFWLLERNNTKIRRDEDIFGLVLRLGGFAALISMYLSTKLSEQPPIFGNAEHSDIEAEHICQI